MTLNELPDQIAEMELRLAYSYRQVRRLSELVVKAESEIDEAIAFDPTLKNDAQRKSMRRQLQSVSDYQALIDQLQSAQDARTEIEIERDRLVRLFAVFKIESSQSACCLKSA